MNWITWGDGKKRIQPQLLNFILETQKSIRLLENMISCYLSFGFYLSGIMHQCLICIPSYSTIWWKSFQLENQHDRKYNFWKEKPLVVCLFVFNRKLNEWKVVTTSNLKGLEESYDMIWWYDCSYLETFSSSSHWCLYNGSSNCDVK